MMRQLSPVRVGRGFVEGRFEDRFEPVVSCFLDNFEHRSELGASCGLYLDGRQVLSVWGGIRDLNTAEPWTESTRALVFSCSKGVLAVCMAMLVDRGAVDLDTRVVEYWPEFGGGGKTDVTVRMLLTHSVGLLYPEIPLTREEVLGWSAVTSWLESAVPLWPPGDGFDYHAHTYGWLVGEVIRRVSGEGPAAFLKRAVADPLGLALSYGVQSRDLAGLARIEPPLPASDVDADRAYRQWATDEPRFLKTLTMNGALPFPGFGGNQTYNSRDVLTAELPSGNLVTSAVDLATFYSATVIATRSFRLVTDRVLHDMTHWQAGGHQHKPQVVGPDLRWGSGFMIDSPPVRPMTGPGSFGHDGAGGSVGFANLDQRLGFAYVTNQMGGVPDDRANELCRAVREAVS